jgi:hypothetical protein
MKSVSIPNALTLQHWAASTGEDFAVRVDRQGSPMLKDGRHPQLDAGAINTDSCVTSSLSWPQELISQADTFRDLALAGIGSLTAALLANLLALCY